MVLTPALNLTFSPGEKEQRWFASSFASDRPANSVAGFQEKRQKILPLRGERAGVREVVEPKFSFQIRKLPARQLR